MTTDTTTPYEALVQFLYQAPIGLVQTLRNGDITMINPMSAQLLMPLAPHGNLLNLFDVLAPLLPGLRERVATHTEASGVICDALRLSAGTQTLSLSLLKLDESALMASLTDVTATVLREEQRLARQLDKAARIDTLTAMPNRAGLLDALKGAMALEHAGAGDSIAVLFLNVDRFNRVNDTHGRALGDELLRLMAERLTRALRQRDAIGRASPRASTAARLGGDEFVVLLEGLRRAGDVNAITQRLIAVLGEPYDIGEQSVHASVSMGVVLRPRDSRDPDGVLQDASIAMHEAKLAGGGGCTVFEPAMRERAARRGGIEAELRRAIAEGELFVVYQPLVDLASGASAGMEALVRWRHPTRGVVPPVEFIEIAEECGLIGALGDLVLNQACRQLDHWRRTLGERAPAIMSVNLSRAQLAEPMLAAYVRRALHDSGIPARCLQFEVTESLAAQDAQVQSRLHELKALGLSLALDDFGTGYSSLSSLHLLPVDVVKIDRSFVCQAESSPHHRVLIEATIRVARSLGMGTLAEGIETEEQATVLRHLQCDKGQGYLFGRPLAAEDATRWLVGRPECPERAKCSWAWNEVGGALA